MKAFVHRPCKITGVKVKRWAHSGTYDSCYRKITSRNWEYVKREAKNQAGFLMYEKEGEVIDDYSDWASAFPCKITFEQFHNGRPVHIVLEESLVDGEYEIIEIAEHAP